MTYDLGPYDPCPCGSGAKYKFCCAAKNKDKRHGKFPIGAVAPYGPDDKTTTKIVASVILREGASPRLQRWYGEDLANDEKVRREIQQFFAEYGVKTVGGANRNLGCPHEEGVDFSVGHECPFCPFWAGKQGIGRRDQWLSEILDSPENIVHDYQTEDEDDRDFYDRFSDEIDDDDDDDEWGVASDEHTSLDEYDAAILRIQAILGNQKRTWVEAIGALCDHLKTNLRLPCQVTGIEDFCWEEPYVIGEWDQKEYEQLKKTQPSFSDCYELLDLSHGDISEWMMFYDDIAAHVRRLSDGKEFIIGLTELKSIDANSPNVQLLNDFATFFVNNR